MEAGLKRVHGACHCGMRIKRLRNLKTRSVQRMVANRSNVESVPVKEVFEGQTAWQGTVEVFDLIGHPKAKRAYAWTFSVGDQKQDRRRIGNSARGLAGKCGEGRDCKQRQRMITQRVFAE